MNLRNLFFHTILFATIAGTAALGVWQLHRREWKHQLIQTIAQRTAKPISPLPSPIDETWMWREVEFTGSLDDRKSISLPRYMTFKNRPGEWGDAIYAPMTLPDGRVILFRIGWVSHESQKTFYTGITRGHWKAIIRPFEKNIQITVPFSKPQGRTLMDASAYDDFHVPRQNYFLDSLSGYDESGPNPDFFFEPVRLWRGTPDLPDNHLIYAMTWFSLAVVLAVMYGRRLWDMNVSLHPPNMPNG